MRKIGETSQHQPWKTMVFQPTHCWKVNWDEWLNQLFGLVYVSLKFIVQLIKQPFYYIFVCLLFCVCCFLSLFYLLFPSPTPRFVNRSATVQESAASWSCLPDRIQFGSHGFRATFSCNFISQNVTIYEINIFYVCFYIYQ